MGGWEWGLLGLGGQDRGFSACGGGQKGGDRWSGRSLPGLEEWVPWVWGVLDRGLPELEGASWVWRALSPRAAGGPQVWGPGKGVSQSWGGLLTLYLSLSLPGVPRGIIPLPPGAPHHRRWDR